MNSTVQSDVCIYYLMPLLRDVNHFPSSQVAIIFHRNATYTQGVRFHASPGYTPNRKATNDKYKLYIYKLRKSLVTW